MEKEKKEGWTHPEAAEKYAQTADIIIPERKEILSIISKVAVELGSMNPKIIDLGCGLGDVTAGILKLKPQADVLMIDFSDEMIRRSSERFRDNKNITVVHWSSVKEKSLSIALIFIKFVKLFIKCKTGI
ncbi:class I SAM-dependent methyltransferase [Methanosarcina spelaei]|uniref:class I SAM-dependent methyltransferase n=1 Tax=Methanosarcina spelaei TaxID=1036679 RepID=UPI001FEC11D8|nr:class I SAM-dependent methyltransferase [Methanosarcina spelaei]